MHVSIVIPARNAALTVADTLESLIEQSHRDWDAIVVDNGSTDDTAAIVAGIAASDPRIKLERFERAGVSAARNHGLRSARSDWLLFLDADDILLPQALDSLTTVAAARPELDAVHCGWRRLAPNGEEIERRPAEQGADLFELLAVTCPFVIHACLVRRDRVVELGGFDEDLAIAEDWDLWQRLARAGARFGTADGCYAVYRMRADSASGRAAELLDCAARVIARGHGRDPRVADPAPAYAAGADPEGIPAAVLTVGAYAAGFALGRGEDTGNLIETMREYRLGSGALAPGDIASCIRVSAPPAAGVGPGGAARLFGRIRPELESFLGQLEEISGTLELRRRALMILHREALRSAPAEVETLGRIQHAVVDLEVPLCEIQVNRGCERVLVSVRAGPEGLGAVELPACGTAVPVRVVADAIAAGLAWEILGTFAERELYPDLRRQLKSGGSERAAALAADLGTAPTTASLTHERVGWTVLLQELFGDRARPGAGFYDHDASWPGSRRRIVLPGTPLEYDLLEAPPAVVSPASGVRVIVSLAGVTLGIVEVPLGRHPGARAGAVISAILATLGMELARAVAREALIGRPWDGGSIRDALVAGRRSRPEADEPLIVRRDPFRFGLGSSRQAVLPLDPSLISLARRAGDTVRETEDFEATTIAYRPDVLEPFRRRRDSGSRPPRRSGRRASATPPQARVRSQFEELFASKPDPWRYDSPYEQRKYEQTLEMLPDGAIGRALEIGCAEGHFTEMLAGRVRELTAADISAVALGRAAERCRQRSNVRFLQLDLAGAELPGDMDLIVCSEVLYYLGDRERLEQVARRMRAALKPGGHLLTAHAHLLVDDPGAPGYDWAVPFGAHTFSAVFDSVGLQLAERIWTPYYRVERYRRPRREVGERPAAPTQRSESAVDPPPDVAAFFHPAGGEPPAAAATAAEGNASTATTVPILMYHRVSPDPDPGARRWCVTPEELAEQLRYLADAGYRSIDYQEWHRHSEARRPLVGPAVIISFDDGYRDFAEHAWPLLAASGFSANVFLPTGHVGGVNSWEGDRIPRIPLMSWEQVRALEEEGVGFGSHTVRHPMLTALPVADAAHELLESRAALAEKVARPLPVIAYPYGDVDGALMHLAGACGYEFGLTCRGGRAGFGDGPLELPRIEVEGGKGLDRFVARLAGPQPSA